jgi:hypothetical protein
MGSADYHPTSYPDYPCACGCNELIEYAYRGKRRIYVSQAHRLRAYRRDNPAYVKREAERSRARRAVAPHAECACGCGKSPPPRAGSRGAQPKYASSACQRRARKAAV